MAGHNRGARADRRDDGPRTSGFGIGSPVSIELEPIRTPKPSTNGHERFLRRCNCKCAEMQQVFKSGLGEAREEALANGRKREVAGVGFLVGSHHLVSF